MTNGNGGQVPTRIVELLISNINELTKQVQSVPNKVSEEVARDLEKLVVAVTTVINNINTPPRNEEIDKKLDTALNKVDDGHGGISSEIQALSELVQEQLIDKLKWMIRSVWLVVGFFSLAVLIASIFMSYQNKDFIKDLKKSVAVEATVENTEDLNTNTRIEAIEKALKEHTDNSKK